MGSLIGSLTQNTPQQGMALAHQAAQTGPQASTADISGGVDNPGLATYSSPPPMQQPSMAPKPSFLQAANSGPAGMPNAAPPGLTKAGKLATLLSSGLQGALAGRAAQEQTIAQTGGRRAGGAGMAFQAGYQLPWQRAEQGQELQRSQAATQLAQAGNQPVSTPYGNLPAALAPKLIAPTLGYEGKIGAAQIGAGAKESVASTQAASRESVAGTAATSREKVAQISQGLAIPVDETVATLAGIPEMAGQKVGKATWANINKSLEAKGYHTQDMGKNGSDENSGMWLMDKAGNRIKQVSPNSLTFQRGASFAQNKPEAVADPNDPGNVYYTTAAEAMNKHLPSPQGAGTIGAKTVARSEAPKSIGDQKVAFNTAIQHADLLRTAAKALNNGDEQTLNGLSNRFKNEFGSTGPITAEVIADAYGREATSMLSKGHMTDSEISSVGKTVDPRKQSFAQIDSVLGAYQALAKSKMNMLSQQAQSASGKKTPAPTNGATRTIVF